MDSLEAVSLLPLGTWATSTAGMEGMEAYAALEGSAHCLGIDGELLDCNEKVGLAKNGLPGSGAETYGWS